MVAVVFRSVNELGVVVLEPPNNGLLRKEYIFICIFVNINIFYLAPSEASDAANGVDDEPKPVVTGDESFESVLVKYVDEELVSSDFSRDDISPNFGLDKLWKPKPFCLNWPNKRTGVDALFTSLWKI